MRIPHILLILSVLTGIIFIALGRTILGESQTVIDNVNAFCTAVLVQTVATFIPVVYYTATFALFVIPVAVILRSIGGNGATRGTMSLALALGAAAFFSMNPATAPPIHAGTGECIRINGSEAAAANVSWGGFDVTNLGGLSWNADGVGDIGATGVRVATGYFDAIDVTTLVLSALDGTVIGGTTPAAATFTTLTATGGGALTGTWTDLGSVSTVDINGGTVDGVTIGGASAGAGTFTTLNATGGGALTGTWTDLGTVSTVDINGGTLDAVAIGVAAAASANFTNATVVSDLLLGTAISQIVGGSTLQSTLQINGTDNDTASQHTVRWSSDASGPTLILGKSRNSTPGSFTIVVDGDLLGTITWRGDDGTDINTPVVDVFAEIDGTPGSNDMPGAFVVRTNSGNGGPTVMRLRVGSQGRFTCTTSCNWADQPIQIATASQDASPGTTLDGEIRLWHDSNAGGVDGRILFQVGVTTYQVNADAGLYFENRPARKAADIAFFLSANNAYKIEATMGIRVEYDDFFSEYPSLTKPEALGPAWSLAFYNSIVDGYTEATGEIASLATLEAQGPGPYLWAGVATPELRSVSDFIADLPYPDVGDYHLADENTNETLSALGGAQIVLGDAVVLHVDRVTTEGGIVTGIHTAPSRFIDELRALTRGTVRPGCDPEHRGDTWTTFDDDAGDSFAVCLRSAVGAYAWAVK